MIDVWNALWAGIVGGLAMSLMMMAARRMGLIEANMERYQGCMLTGKDEGSGSYAAGLTMHLLISVAVAVLYAWGFTLFWGEANWYLGLLLAVVHWLIGGLVLPAMDGMNPCVRNGRIRAFGAFGSNYGAMMVAGFLMGHLLFGLIVGWLYDVPVI